MNQIQAEVIFLNLLRQADEFVFSILGTNPTPNAGSFRARVVSLYNTYQADKAAFVTSSVQLGFLATLIKEYGAFSKSEITQIGTPEILIGQIRWDDIYDKPDILAASADWADITNKPTTFPHDEVTWAEVSGKPTTFPPNAHAHNYASITDKPATFPSDWNTMTNKPTIPAGSGGGVVNVYWNGDDTNSTIISMPSGMTPQAMIVYEYEHGIRAFWNGEFGNYLGFDDGTAAEGVTFGSENMTLAPGTLANKTNYLYYATIWG